jgi:hypothetical protein
MLTKDSIGEIILLERFDGEVFPAFVESYSMLSADYSVSVEDGAVFGRGAYAFINASGTSSTGTNYWVGIVPYDDA